MMKSVLAAAAIVAFGATSALAADCGWKAKQDTIADLNVTPNKHQTAMQSAPADAVQTEKRAVDRPQLAVDPRTDDTADQN